MLLSLFTTVLLGVAPMAQDTAVAVRAGDRLVLDGLSGFVSVRSWDRESLEVQVDDEDDAWIGIHRSGNQLQLETRRGGRRDGEMELRVMMPAWMDVEISGRDLEMDLRDLAGRVVVRNMDGDINLRNLSGTVIAVSVQGGIMARELHGPTTLRTGRDDVEVDGASGELWIETISGDLELENMNVRRLEVRTTSGDVDFRGRLSPEGEYLLRSHDGDLTLTLAEPVRMDVSILVYDGEFHSDFTVRARSFRSGEELQFTLGGGGGRLVLETFDGDIEILRER